MRKWPVAICESPLLLVEEKTHRGRSIAGQSRSERWLWPAGEGACCAGGRHASHPTHSRRSCNSISPLSHLPPPSSSSSLQQKKKWTPSIDSRKKAVQRRREEKRNRRGISRCLPPRTPPLTGERKAHAIQKITKQCNAKFNTKEK